MVKRKDSYEVIINEKMRGGEGSVRVEPLLTPDELNNKGRLFAKITVEPGSSVGFHVHEGEMESYVVISGEAEYSDNGEIVKFLPGDTSYTPSGTGHSLKCAGNEPLVVIALILFE